MSGSSSASPSLRLPGLINGRYEIRQKLGSGSFGSVYKAWDKVEQKIVAIKTLRAKSNLSPSWTRIQDEFKAIKSLDHPQIAEAYDFGFTQGDNIPFFTREYVEGQPLSSGPPYQENPSAYLKPIFDLLDALQYVHAQGILHLDIHAGNIIVSEQKDRGGVLIDFGLAGSLETPLFGDSSHSWATYPPELLNGGRATPASDIFLVGRLLHLRLTGHSRGLPKLPNELAHWGTRQTLELERIMLKALQPDPKDRFRSAKEFREALFKAIGENSEIRDSIHPTTHRWIGREADLNHIERLLHDTREGASRLQVITGKPGVGRSRLLSEAKVKAQLMGLYTVEVKFSKAESLEPELIASLNQLHTARKELLIWLDPLSPSFGGTPFERAQRAAKSYYQSLEQPLVLLLDDVDWIDSESQILLKALVDEILAQDRDGNKRRGLCLLMAQSDLSEWGQVQEYELKLNPLSNELAQQFLENSLFPLVAHPSIVDRAIHRAKGIPLYLNQLAENLKREWQPHRRIPQEAELPSLIEIAEFQEGKWPSDLLPEEVEILKILSLGDRFITLEELTFVSRISEESLKAFLSKLIDLRLIQDSAGEFEESQFKEIRYALLQRGLLSACTRSIDEETTRKIYTQFCDYLESQTQLPLRDRAGLARYKILSGEQDRGRQLVLEIYEDLKQAGAFQRAIDLLEMALKLESNEAQRSKLIELMSSTLTEIGDDQQGIQLLRPLFDAEPEESSKNKIRLGRCLGIHLHRSGLIDEAQALFESTQKVTQGDRDLVDLIFIDSELAELYLFQGHYEEANKACERGLARLESTQQLEASFKGSMEVMLLASRGHIQLRCFSMEESRKSFLTAFEKSNSFGNLSDRATILHNLGVLENQSNRYREARSYFQQAQEILIQAGDRPNQIKIYTNLALIEAKIANRDKAVECVERAESLLSLHSGQRLECFVAYSRAQVHAIFGECEEAIHSFQLALKLSLKLQDHALCRFSEIGLADAYLVSGSYKRALDYLEKSQVPEGILGSPHFKRMQASRVYLIEVLLGRKKKAKESRELFFSIPASDLTYLESWNLLYLGLGHFLSGESSLAYFQEALDSFLQFEFQYGAQLAELGVGLNEFKEQPQAFLKKLLSEKNLQLNEDHKFLKIAHPLLIAYFFHHSNHPDEAEEYLHIAGGAIVGSPYLELDWFLELLKTQHVLKKGEVREARKNLHRCLHCRELLTQLVPSKIKSAFKKQGRFKFLQEISRRLKLQPLHETSTIRIRKNQSFDGMIGLSESMQELFQMIRRVADQDLPILIQGETGTGKNLVARSIHKRSFRSDRDFTIVSCSCLPHELFESELFGHVKGAFTGAETEQSGLLEASDGGTLLLAHVDQISLETQVKLLRILEDRNFRKLGGAELIPFNVRVLATATQDLRKKVEEKSFREDLYYRLAGVTLDLPPLRQRQGDLELLVSHFLETHAQRLDSGVSKIEPEAMELLKAYDWPGNIRELESVLFRALLTSTHLEWIHANDLGSLLQIQPKNVFATYPELLNKDLDEWKRDLEREYITRLFKELDGDMKAIMDRLGVKSTKLYTWLKDLGLNVKDLR